jgi:hypothetical protein
VELIFLKTANREAAEGVTPLFLVSCWWLLVFAKTDLSPKINKRRNMTAFGFAFGRLRNNWFS